MRERPVTDEVLDVLDAYSGAVFDKDVDGFMSLYDDEARIFDAWGRWSYEGADAWRANIEEWFSSLGTERVRVDFEEVEITSDVDVATVSAFVTFAGMSSEGEELRSMQNRITWVLMSGDDGLRIAHEHTSAPAGFEDGKVMLQRPDHE
jgi:uncharacterized protein (TIGR02246 family)